MIMQQLFATSSRFRDQSVVIAGETNGLGRAMAKQFAKLEARVFLIGRDPIQLTIARDEIQYEFPLCEVITRTTDVGDPTQLCLTLHEIGDRYGIHTLICNAGVSLQGRFTEHTISDFEDVFRINFFNVVSLLQTAWPFLATANRGHIGFVSSLAGRLGVPGNSAYSASKFALTGLAECIRIEAATCGIGTTVVYPTDSSTVSLAQVRSDWKSKSDSIYLPMVSPDLVAEAFVRGIQRNQFEVHCNQEARWLKRLHAIFTTFYFRQVDRLVAKSAAN